MVVLGLVSTGTFAAPATAKAVKNSNTDQAFWNAVINRNQDNAYFVMPHVGQVKVTGEVATDLKHTSKGGENQQAAPNAGYFANQSKTGFDLHTAELYLDAGLPSVMLGGNALNTMVHVGLDYDYDNTKNMLDGNSNALTPMNKTMFFPEAYAMMTYSHLFAKVGRQYVNFGTTMHDAITTPVTEVLSKTNKVGATLGLMNLAGFYGDVSFYNGAVKGTTANPKGINDSQNKLHGFAAELGYAMKTNNMNFNAYVDYISNMADVTAINYNIAANKTPRTVQDKVPGVAVHGDFAMNAGMNSSFTVMADYVTATKKFNASELAWGTDGAKPQAYSVEGDYTFLKHHTVTLGFQGTRQAAGLYDVGNAGDTNAFPMPKTRLLAGYTFALNKYVSFEAEYTNDKDYGTSDIGRTTANPYRGSGNTNNTVVGRIRVKF